MEWKEGKWQAFIKAVKEAAAPPFPIHVRRMRLPRDRNGDCSLVQGEGGPHFLVRVSRDLGYQAACYVLVHEVAHAASWGTESPDVDDHDAAFGIAYARIYRAVW